MARLRPKRVRMTKEQNQLYTELEKLVKQANKRLAMLENLTGKQGSFASKELYDHLDSSNIQAIKKGLIKLDKTYKPMQLRAIKKATEEFLEEKTSTYQGIKETLQKYEKFTGKEFTYKFADIAFRSGRNYTWIYDEGITPSEFWGVWVKTCRQEKWNVETWTEQLAFRINREVDEELKKDLESLYLYIME